ncbi:30S ribosomal protein S6 [Pseudoclavibacter triregionum]|nr:30S ribosomal protein S6 [Pseudoclavibacter triregionum]
MHQYELMVILDPEIDERTVAPSLDKFLNVIRNDGGTIDSTDIWGRRRLAYEINKKSEGIYAVVNFTAEPASANELDRQLKLSEAVMRTKVLRAEEAIAMVAREAERREKKGTKPVSTPSTPAAAAKAAPARSSKPASKPASSPAAKVAAASKPAAQAAPKADAPAEKPEA